ncbi:MAG TPA: 30S ribosomal protein S20 [Candidatus Binataceae bacterium]|nr:30S ribosomal protein S20 [Candidatus Binataceae bacterium]
MPHIPVHPSAQKRHRQNLKRREHNRAARTQVRTAVKTAAEAISATDAGAAQEKLRAAISALDKAASKGKLHRNTTRRKIARLSAQFHKKHAQQAQQA